VEGMRDEVMEGLIRKISLVPVVPQA
jgi:hypothetical protein